MSPQLLALLGLVAIFLLINLTVLWCAIAVGYRRSWRRACVERDHWVALYDECEAELERLAYRDDRPVRLLGRAAK